MRIPPSCPLWGRGANSSTPHLQCGGDGASPSRSTNFAREVFTDARLSSKQREPARYRPRAPIGPRCSSGRVGLQNRPGGCGSTAARPARRRRGAKLRAREREPIPQGLPIFWECSVESLHDSLKTRRCWCDSNRSHHSRKRRVRRRSHKPTLPVQLGILLPFFFGA